MYAAAVEPSTAEVPRWARGGAVALVAAPGVLLAQLVTTGRVPPAGACLLAAAAVAAVACLLPTGGRGLTAAVAAVAQLAGHVVLAVAVPVDGGRDGCLGLVGRGAGVLVDPSSACPPGAAAVPIGWLAVVAAVGAAVGAAVLVVAGSGLLAAVTGALVAAVAAAAVAVRGLLAGVRAVLVDVAALRLPVPDVLPAPVPAPAPLRSVWRPGTPARRGPPAVLAAA